MPFTMLVGTVRELDADANADAYGTGKANDNANADANSNGHWPFALDLWERYVGP